MFLHGELLDVKMFLRMISSTLKVINFDAWLLYKAEYNIYLLEKQFCVVITFLMSKFKLGTMSMSGIQIEGCFINIVDTVVISTITIRLKADFLCVKPVSYTHLTLPTKLEV